MRIVKNLTENITIITAIFIFIGYYNLYSYYSFFDIDIHNYLSTSELLLSFLPISIYIIFTLIIIFVYVSLFIDNIKEYENYKTFNFKKLKSYFKKKPFDWINFIPDILHFIINLLGLLIFLVATMSIIIGIVNKDDVLYDGKIVAIVILLVWFIYAHNFIEKNLTKSNIVKDIKVFRATSLIVLLIAIITLINTGKAYKIRNGYSLYSIEFKIKNKRIKTDKNNIYIGATKEYIFIRNNTSQKTIVYKKSDIDKLIISKVKTTETKLKK